MRLLRSSRIVSHLLVVLLLSITALPFAPIDVGGGTAMAQGPCDYPSETLQLMAPAAPGGGWDTTAREMQQVLQSGIVDQSVEVFNVEGAGGTIGLAQLVNDNKSDPNTLMVMGMVMIGAIATNASEVTLEDVTPIARLTAEWEVIVVPADSEYQTLQDLITAFQADPGGISWAGGSAGGTDHILVGLIAQATGVDPTQINYIPYSGGGEALAAILGGQVSAGVSGLGEWQDQIASGELRALAISGSTVSQATPVAGGATPAPASTPASPAIPTLKEQGVDVELANWRGIVAPPEIPAEQVACIVDMVQQMHDSEAWQAVLAKYGWQDYYLPGDEYAQFLPTETERITGILQSLGLVA
jgi:putative tricarboxylic transport membrane protein